MNICVMFLLPPAVMFPISISPSQKYYKSCDEPTSASLNDSILCTLKECDICFIGSHKISFILLLLLFTYLPLYFSDLPYDSVI